VLAAPEQAHGAILDGVVRTVPQAEGLTGVLKGLGRSLDLVLMFQIPDEELVKRLSGRTVCDACGAIFAGRKAGETHHDCPKSPKGKLGVRKDDEPDAVRNRLRVYQAQTAPVLAWYRSNDAPLKEIDATGSVDEVRARVLAAAGVR
jgi:adenylate kinase